MTIADPRRCTWHAATPLAQAACSTHADRSTFRACENLVFIASWEAAGNTAPPVFVDRAYDRMVDDPATEIDEAHHFEPHYDLHVWLHRENPRGVFAPFNPNATCAHHRGSAHMH